MNNITKINERKLKEIIKSALAEAYGSPVQYRMLWADDYEFFKKTREYAKHVSSFINIIEDDCNKKGSAGDRISIEKLNWLYDIKEILDSTLKAGISIEES